VGAGLVVGSLVVGSLAGCAVPASTASAPSPSGSSGSSSGTPTTAPPVVVLTVGALTIDLLPEPAFTRAGGAVTPAPGEQGSVTATIALPAGATVPVVVGRLDPPTGGTLAVLADGSVSALNADGGWLGGVVPSGVGTTVRALADGRVEVSAGTAATLWLSTTAVEQLHWGTREGGSSLSVTPTPWARSGSLAAEAGLWAAISADPQAATSTMRAQLDCHLLGARDKATWNLEPWRPDVDSATMIATACNPT